MEQLRNKELRSGAYGHFKVLISRPSGNVELYEIPIWRKSGGERQGTWKIEMHQAQSSVTLPKTQSKEQTQEKETDSRAHRTPCAFIQTNCGTGAPSEKDSGQ